MHWTAFSHSEVRVVVVLPRDSLQLNVLNVKSECLTSEYKWEKKSVNNCIPTVTVIKWLNKRVCLHVWGCVRKGERVRCEYLWQLFKWECLGKEHFGDGHTGVHPCLLTHQTDMLCEALKRTIYQTKHNMSLEEFNILETSRVI